MTLNIYIAESGLLHDTGPGHPEQIARLQTLIDLFNEPAFEGVPKIKAEEASIEQIKRAHPIEYIHTLQDAQPIDQLIYLDADTVMSPDSFQAALESAGGVCMAIDDVMSGKANEAFCVGRPPGHHAEPAQAMGFCYFNNVVIGALHAQKEHGIECIAIIDFDVHHGNGTDTMARQHDGLFFASTHQDRLFPADTGVESTNIDGQVINITLNSGEGSEQFRRAYTEQILPALDEFKPELIMISAGFDAHKDDPLGGLNLTEEDFAWITEELKKKATQHANGRIVSVLEGGYNLDALKSSVRAHIKALQI